MEAGPNDVVEPSEVGDPTAPSPPALAPPDDKPAVVIVQYRPRQWWSTLLPPALFVLLACAILSYRIWAPDWLGWDPWAPLRGPAPSAAPPAIVNHSRHAPPEVEPAPAPPLVPPQATIDVSPTPPPPVALSTTEVPGKLSVSIRLSTTEEAPPAVPGVVPVEPRIATPEPLLEAAPPPVSRAPGPANPPKAAEVLADIAQEARAKQVERAELEGLKADLLDHQTLADRARDYDARRAFRVALRQVLQQVGHVDDAVVAGRIHALADESGIGARGGRNPAATGGGHGEGIRGLRRSGVAEREILRQLEEGHNRNRVSRIGPRNEAEATIRAARDLLAVALEPIPASKDARPPAGTAKGSSGALKFPISARRH